MTVAMAVEGVLGSSDTFNLTMQRNDAGVKLYGALKAVDRVFLLSSEPDYDKISHWLRSQGLTDYDMILPRPDDLTASETVDVRAAQIRALRGSRTVLSFIVDAVPLVVVHAMSVGLPALLYAPPRPAPGRMDLGQRQIRDWNAIEHELDIQQGLKEGVAQ